MVIVILILLSTDSSYFGHFSNCEYFSEGRGPVVRPPLSPRLVTGKSPAGYGQQSLVIYV